MVAQNFQTNLAQHAKGGLMDRRNLICRNDLDWRIGARQKRKGRLCNGTRQTRGA
jgi:hypothetical protein